MLFNEPKLLKQPQRRARAPGVEVSVLFNEPKLLKKSRSEPRWKRKEVSVLFNEPKLLKQRRRPAYVVMYPGFSALQRAEIAETVIFALVNSNVAEFQCSSTSRNC